MQRRFALGFDARMQGNICKSLFSHGKGRIHPSAQPGICPCLRLNRAFRTVQRAHRSVAHFKATRMILRQHQFRPPVRSQLQLQPQNKIQPRNLRQRDAQRRQRDCRFHGTLLFA